MSPRKATPAERAEMTRLVREFINTFGRRTLNSAINQAEDDLRPPLTPRQQRRADSWDWENRLNRRWERERREEEAAAEAKRQRREHVELVRRRVYAELGVRDWRDRVPSWAREKPPPAIRSGLNKAIRGTLRDLGLVRDWRWGPGFMVADARAMRPAVEAILAWERRRLEMLTRRLERAGEWIKAREHRTAKRRVDEVRRLRAEGVGATDIARRLGINRRSVYKIGPGPQR